MRIKVTVEIVHDDDTVSTFYRSYATAMHVTPTAQQARTPASAVNDAFNSAKTRARVILGREDDPA